MLAVRTTPRLALKNIVVPTDFTAASRAAVDCAIAIATRYGAKISLVHAVESGTKASREKTEPRAVHRLAEAEWNLLSEANRCADLECERHLLKGTAPELVEQFLAIEHADLIVLGAPASRGFRRLLMRPAAAEHIFRHVRCPVLVIGPLVRSDWTTWNPRRILLASDLETDESKGCCNRHRGSRRAQCAAGVIAYHPTVSSAIPGGFRADLSALLPIALAAVGFQVAPK